MRRVKDMPGPGQYKLPSTVSELPKGGRISKSSAKRTLELRSRASEQLPGPGQYSPKHPSDLGSSPGVRMSPLVLPKKACRCVGVVVRRRLGLAGELRVAHV